MSVPTTLGGGPSDPAASRARAFAGPLAEFARQRSEHLDAVAEAFTLAEETLRSRRTVLGSEHPDTIKSLILFSTFAEHRDTGNDADKLRQRCQEALTLARRVLGSRHPDTMRAMSNLARSYDRLAFMEGSPSRGESRQLREELLELQT